MHSPKPPYALFRDTYLNGLRAIEQRHVDLKSAIDKARSGELHDAQVDELDDVLVDEADRAKNLLAATNYGRVLLADSTLCSILNRLETGLGRLVEASIESGVVSQDDPVVEWAQREGYMAERTFRFWGSMGALFYYFRDLGGSLDADQELELRKQYEERAQALLDHLTEMTDHVAIHLVYKPAMVKRLEGLRATLAALKSEMQTPFDDNSTDANYLHGGDTLLRRQFISAVNLMAFELFGHIRSADLGLLLDLKSSTAEDLGFLAWWQTLQGSHKLRDTQARELRRYINKGLQSSRSLASSRGWVTRPVLEYFAQNREQLPDGESEFD